MGAIASQITSLTIVYSAVNSPHKWPVTRKMFPFDDVIMVSMTGQFGKHWYGNVVILTKYSSLAAPKVAKMTTSSEVIDEHFVKMKKKLRFGKYHFSLTYDIIIVPLSLYEWIAICCISSVTLLCTQPFKSTIMKHNDISILGKVPQSRLHLSQWSIIWWRSSIYWNKVDIHVKVCWFDSFTEGR